MFSDIAHCLHGGALGHLHAFSALLAEEDNNWEWTAGDIADPEGDLDVACNQFIYCTESPSAFTEIQADPQGVGEGMASWFATDQTGWLGRDMLWGSSGKLAASCEARTEANASAPAGDVCVAEAAEAVGDDGSKGGPGVYDFDYFPVSG